jgi:hypothetical protein
MHVIQGDFQRLMVESQIDILTPNLFLSHNLCINIQMSHVSPFWTSMFQEPSNGIYIF